MIIFFLQHFSANINFIYTCFDRVIIRGHIRKLFFEAGKTPIICAISVDFPLRRIPFRRRISLESSCRTQASKISRLTPDSIRRVIQNLL